jgi:hypothetical protein
VFVDIFLQQYHYKKNKISLEQGNKLTPSSPVKNKISLKQGNKFLQNL